MVSQDVDRAEPTIRVLMAHLSGLLSHAVAHVVQEQADMFLVGQTQDYIKLLLDAGSGVDVVILGVEEIDSIPGICSHLLVEYPDLKILALTKSGTSAKMYWVGLRSQSLEDISLAQLVESIRIIYMLNPMS